MFAADPGEPGLDPEVRGLQHGEPAALAGVRPETPAAPQLGPELLPVGRVVSAHTPTATFTLNALSSSAAHRTKR